MHEDTVSNGFFTIASAVIFVLALLVFNGLHQSTFKNIKTAKNQVESHQLVQMGEYQLNESVITGADVIYGIESAYDTGFDVYVNGSRIGLTYLEKARKDATFYNGSPFNIIRTSYYERSYIYDSDHEIIGVAFNTH